MCILGLKTVCYSLISNNPSTSPDVVGNDHSRSSSLDIGSPKQDLTAVYSVPVPQDARRDTPSESSRASSEGGGQPAEEVKQMEQDDDDDDDEDESVEYQIPRSTPVHVGGAHTHDQYQVRSLGYSHSFSACDILSGLFQKLMAHPPKKGEKIKTSISFLLKHLGIDKLRIFLTKIGIKKN